jgi:polar amino acid transport system substrate-binding protein
MKMHDQVIAQLAPFGHLRAGINLGNNLLVTGRDPSGDPTGVAPDMARAIAARLGVPVKLASFAGAGETADAVDHDLWDIALIGAEPARAEKIAFTAAYAEIEATYLVPADSPIAAVSDVDRPGVRIAVTSRSAYDLWLTRHIKRATLRRAETHAEARKLFVGEKLDTLAGLKPRLLLDIEQLPDTRLLDGRFTAVQQAIGTRSKNNEGAAFLSSFVAEAKSSGLVAKLIAKHRVAGLSVAADG